MVGLQAASLLQLGACSKGQGVLARLPPGCPPLFCTVLYVPPPDPLPPLPCCSAAAPEAPDAAVAATSSSTAVKQKRTPEDIAFESLIFLLTSLRTFYMGTSKAVHTPARRREEQASVPTVPMKAAALNLALLMVGNFQLHPWQQYNEAEIAAAAAAAAGIAPTATSKCDERVRAATVAIRGRAMHYIRLTEELNQVLFDHRRRYCHLLVLNYFSALGGMQVRVKAGPMLGMLMTGAASTLGLAGSAVVFVMS